MGLIRNDQKGKGGVTRFERSIMTSIKYLLVIFSFLGLVSCGGSQVILGTDGKPLPKLYDLSKQDSAQVQYRMLDSVNAIRSNVGLGPLVLNAELTAAAATHARDMSIQNRPWHFGSDGSSPLDRVWRVGYAGVFLGEVISETYESEIETLSAWVDDKDTRFVILDPNAREMGVSWFQEPNGKIWWTLITGGRSLSQTAVDPTDE